MRMKRIFGLVLVSVLMLFVWSGPAISKLTIDAVEQTDGGTYVNPTITGGTIDGTPIGQTTPAVGSFTVLNGRYKSVTAITDADVTLTTADLGKSIRMSSAADHVASLPSVGASDDGAKIRIVKTGAGKVIADAADSDLINDSGAGDTIYNDVAAETYAFIDLEYVHAITTWIATGTGTWVTTD